MIIIKPLIQVKGKQYRNKKSATLNLGETVQDFLNIDDADSGSENSRNEKLPVGLKNIGCFDEDQLPPAYLPQS